MCSHILYNVMLLPRRHTKPCISGLTSRTLLLVLKHHKANSFKCHAVQTALGDEKLAGDLEMRFNIADVDGCVSASGESMFYVVPRAPQIPAPVFQTFPKSVLACSHRMGRTFQSNYCIFQRHHAVNTAAIFLLSFQLCFVCWRLLRRVESQGNT